MPNSVTIGRPGPDEYAPFYAGYIERATEEDLLGALAAQADAVSTTFLALPKHKVDFRYAEGKWTPREMLGHLVDCERVMGFRSLWFARQDPAPMPGFEENDWANVSDHGNVPLDGLVEEFLTVRSGHVLMFQHLPAEAWTRLGVANGKPASVRALAHVMLGHVRHHFAVLEERYLAG
jgi:hypothetical protein